MIAHKMQWIAEHYHETVAEVRECEREDAEERAAADAGEYIRDMQRWG